MKTLRDAWANASDTVRLGLIIAVTVVILAGLVYGIGLDWLVTLLGG